MKQRQSVVIMLACTIFGAVGVLCTNSVTKDSDKYLSFNIDSLPNFCAHEHWGSLNVLGGYMPDYDGFYGDIYAGATPRAQTCVWDLIIDPYFGGMLWSAGIDINKPATDAGFKLLQEWWQADPKAALEGFKESTAPLMMGGTIQTTLRGIEAMYDVELHSFDIRQWSRADSLIALRYSDMFTWHKRCIDKASFSELIRPVQPEFYLLTQSEATKEQEAAFTHTIMRVDPFLNLSGKNNSRRDILAENAGIKPIDAGSWRAFIRFYMDLAANNNATGIKSLQAYRRSLDFKFRNDNEVKFSGDLTPEQTTVFQDWVMNELCRQANERGWVHQIHVGTHNLSESSPLPLEALGDRYPAMKIVMLHCWPFFNEAAYLAKNKPNFYIDNCWMPILSPELFEQALDIYINFVPYNKIMLSHDATSVEMAVGSSLFTREILARKLLEQKKVNKMTDEQLGLAARDMLHNNAVRLYNIGEPVK